MKHQNKDKSGVRMVEKKHLWFELDSQGKPKSGKRWLSDAFAFLYDRIMKNSIFPKKFAADMQRHQQILQEALETVRNKRVLELGTGSGAAIQYLDYQNEYSGVDVSPGLLLRAAKKFARAGFRQPDFYILNAADLPFNANYFDACLCILTLNFFADIPAVVKEVQRVLKPGGYFLGCVPVPEWNHQKSKIQGTLFSAAELEQIFEQNHFRFRNLPVKNGALFYFAAEKMN